MSFVMDGACHIDYLGAHAQQGYSSHPVRLSVRAQTRL